MGRVNNAKDKRRINAEKARNSLSPRDRAGPSPVEGFKFASTPPKMVSEKPLFGAAKTAKKYRNKLKQFKLDGAIRRELGPSFDQSLRDQRQRKITMEPTLSPRGRAPAPQLASRSHFILLS